MRYQRFAGGQPPTAQNRPSELASFTRPVFHHGRESMPARHLFTKAMTVIFLLQSCAYLCTCGRGTVSKTHLLDIYPSKESKHCRLRDTRLDQLFQLRCIHPRHPRYDTAPKWERMSVPHGITAFSNRRHLACIHSHCKAAREFRFNGNFHSVLISGLLDREHGQYLDDHRPHGRVRKMPPDANTPPEPECNIFDVIRVECAVVVEEAFGDKFLRLWVFGFISAHGPDRGVWGSFNTDRTT